ncbi:Reverse transcriptase zinc-binding domain [Dillenia turbinata]|uniref:Reverse transcriptase zinc-binding domain n=1 Tax=Dillenia turbinata TaxID=194707 RepID=A0AAN8ZNE9_9MAGN
MGGPRRTEEWASQSGPRDISWTRNRMAMRKIITNMEKVKRGIIQDDSCPICTNGDESIKHVLRECNHARNIWKRINNNIEEKHEFRSDPLLP